MAKVRPEARYGFIRAEKSPESRMISLSSTSSTIDPGGMPQRPAASSSDEIAVGECAMSDGWKLMLMRVHRPSRAAASSAAMRCRSRNACMSTGWLRCRIDAAVSPSGPRISASWEKIERVGACTMGWNAKA